MSDRRSGPDSDAVPGRVGGPQAQQGGVVTMSDGDDLMSLVHKLSREAQHASKTCGRKELDALQSTAQQYVTLYLQLKARGVIQ